MNTEEKEISFKLVKELYVGRIEKNLYSLRVGHWIVNGKTGELILEKRHFWRDYKGNVKSGKVGGLNAADMYRIVEFLPELSALMNFPLMEHKK